METSTTDNLSVIVRGLTKSYPGRKTDAINNLDLEVVRGDFVAILGPSGCGKSTLLNIIGGIDKPGSGSVEVEGLNLTDSTDRALTDFRRQKIGFVFQFFNLLPTFSVRENISVPLEISGYPKKEIEREGRSID